MLTAIQPGVALSQLPATPEQLYNELFITIQSQGLFVDSKTFVDCIPKATPFVILNAYKEAKDKPVFNLALFVQEYFTSPQEEAVVCELEPADTIIEHIHRLWKVLERKTDTPQTGSSLLPLPYPYVVPGGRFREVYYWDSYFTMLGLQISNQQAMIENMVKNFAHLIHTYGHIPNGNRTYYTSRSQPPFFGLMIDLLNKQDEELAPYYQALEKEYLYWMEDAWLLQPGEGAKRVVRMKDGTLLNRYWDSCHTPRPESYLEDVRTVNAIIENYVANTNFPSAIEQEQSIEERRQKAYADLRAAAASGWDFSSRWLRDGKSLTTIETTDILPIDLNCLLLYYENILTTHATDSAIRAAAATNASKRLVALEKYFWNADLQFFTDYHFIDKKQTTHLTLAGAFPLFLPYATQEQANKIAKRLQTDFLKDGGFLTTLNVTGEQWDAPNGWAPLQWIAHQGLKQYGFDGLAELAAIRWIQLNADVYKRTGQLFEKYNVVDTSLEAGGGEYPNQDGFGWTNGVLLALIRQYGPID